jgi:stearoyl-CoA desaturase (delta-9 desaturase)
MQATTKLETAPAEPVVLSEEVSDHGGSPAGSRTDDTPVSRVQRLAAHFGWTKPIERKRDTISWWRNTPFLLMQLAPLAIFFVGFSWIALGVAFAFWFLRKFAITGFYHRYFSHRAFKTSRVMQAIMAFWGGLAVQKGALWWAAHHRDHHRYSDQDEDIHSPVRHGFVWSHIGWVLSKLGKPTNLDKVKELAKFPELRFLNKHHWIPALTGGVGMFFLGKGLESWAPQLGTDGPQMLVWGFFVSTFVLYHTTYSINSLTHVFGTRRYKTSDDSRNHWLFALITLGEGWHNNHHQFPSAARMGFFWYEFDITWWGLWVMEKLGLIWDVRPVPPQARSMSG